jgi:Holliday junction DNA helicase RuvA
VIDYFNGILSYKTLNTAVVEVAGIGYGISITSDTFNKLPSDGKPVKLYIVESTGMYGGVISYYGFLSKQEREMFNLIKDEVPSTGAKKAMEYLDKISKSFADFKAAIVKKDVSMLSGIFGFTKKTSEKLVAALKDKIANVSVNDSQKWSNITGNSSSAEAVAGLIALGYKETNARETVNKILTENKDLSVEQIITEALKYL